MRALSIDDLNDAIPIISKFERLAKDLLHFPKPLMDIVRDWLGAEEVKVGCKRKVGNDRIIGFAAINLRENQILAVYADDLDGEFEQQEIDKNEVELLDWCFQEFTKPPIRIEYRGFTSNMKKSLFKRGYSEFKRVGMVVRSEVFLEKESINPPDGFVTDSYTPESRVHVAEVIARVNEEHIDALIYPEFFGSTEACIDFLKKMEEGELGGEYKKEYSKVLVTDGNIIGYCLLTVTDNIAVIQTIGLLPEFQGRGLGKMLLSNTIIDMLGFETSVRAIGLAVTRSNPAKYLYEGQGFKISDEFSSFAYTEKE